MSLFNLLPSLPFRSNAPNAPDDKQAISSTTTQNEPSEPLSRKGRRHPLHFITPSEISAASEIARRRIRERENAPDLEVRFKSISLHEPPKKLLLPYLDAEANAVSVDERPYVPRCLDCVYAFDNERHFGTITISLDAQTEVGYDRAKKGQHSSFDRAEIVRLSTAILDHPDVVAEIKKLLLPRDTVIQCDTWMFGADKNSSEDTHKFIQALLYARDKHPDSNQYAFPLPFSPVWDVFTDKLDRIDPLATGGTQDGLAYHTAPIKPMAHCRPNEYMPDLQPSLRTDLKPLHVSQPEGASFRVLDENCVEWQKWRFRVGFNYREGLTLSDIRYDGRPVFYRLSLSEMTVPYGDPRSPFHRKQAFDLGDAGAGATANNLSLGCDCLGTIKYFGGWLNDDKGQAVEAPNVICLHEQDNGISWKHSNHRTGNAAVARARILVVQTILTVGNYEYIFAWHFAQDGSITLETRLTGILSTALIDEGKTSPWGTVVSPGVMAPTHQHLFSLRIDPMIDGQNNTIVQEDTIALPEDDEQNPFGNAWKVNKTIFENSGATNAAPDRNRVIKIVNESHTNTISGNFKGYKLVPQPCQLLLAGSKSVVRKRARFAEHHVWVTKYRDGDLWAGGKYTNQSLEETDGVKDYAARKENVRNEDVVVWHTFGVTHNPRVEDFPVMPAEMISIHLKPSDFFDRNPALDVPPSTQEKNQSILVGMDAGAKTVGEMEGKGGCCGDAAAKEKEKKGVEAQKTIGLWGRMTGRGV